MKRRSFFKTAALSGSAVAISGLTGCRPQSGETVKDGPSANFELNEATAGELQKKMESGELTSKNICHKYLNRIEALDPFLKSVIEINPDALEIASVLDQERKEGKKRGPLHGIPVMIKDNINTADKMKTTAGSLVLENHIPATDALIVTKLREAGAVLLGKTNLSEWANFRSRDASSGWSGRGGQTRNPYYLDRNPCGSSAGSGAAVSANLCTLTIGTETNGSIMGPASMNGVVGIKPTVGLWSRSGIIPISRSHDTAGPMTRTVTDAALLLGALAGFDDNDDDPFLERGEIFSDYTQFLKAGIEGMRIGVLGQIRGFHDYVLSLFEEAKKVFNSKGAEIIEGVTFKHQGEWGGPSWEVMLYEFKAGLNQYLEKYNAPVKNLAEIIEFNKAHADREMPWFGQEIFEEAQKMDDLNSSAYLKAREDMRLYAGKEGIDAAMNELRIDAIIVPTAGPAWCIDWVNGDYSTGGSASLAAISGYPAITIPMGFMHGLPVGITVFGRAWSEPVLLKIAYAFEQATLHRKAPEFKNSILT